MIIYIHIYIHIYIYLFVRAIDQGEEYYYNLHENSDCTLYVIFITNPTFGSLCLIPYSFSAGIDNIFVGILVSRDCQHNM